MEEQQFELFVGKDISYLISKYSQELISEIASISREDIQHNIQKKCEYLTQKYIIRTPQFLEDDIEQDIIDCKVDVSRDPRRAIFDRKKPAYVSGTKHVLYIPFMGDKNVFHHSPKGSIGYTSEIIAVVKQQQLIYSIKVPNDVNINPEAHFDHVLNKIKECLKRVDNDIYTWFNGSLYFSIESKLNERHQKILKDLDRVKGSRFPLKKQENILPTVETTELHVGTNSEGVGQTTQKRTFMNNKSRLLQRVKYLDEILELQYEKLYEFQKELVLLANAPQKFELKQRIKREILPEIKKHESEYGQILIEMSENTAITEQEAEKNITLTMQAIKEVEEYGLEKLQPELKQSLTEIKEKLTDPGKAATAKLRLAIPIIPLILSYVMEIDTESSIIQVWKRIKSFFRDSNNNSSTSTDPGTNP